MRVAMLFGVLVVGCGVDAPGIEGRWDRVDAPMAYEFTATGYQQWWGGGFEVGSMRVDDGSLVLTDERCGGVRTVPYALDGGTLVLDGATYARGRHYEGPLVIGKQRPCP